MGKRVRKPPSSPSSPALVLFRHLLVAALAAFLATYLWRSFHKFWSGRVAVSSVREPRTEFSFPAVGVCGVVPPNGGNFSVLDGKDFFDPWIERVFHDIFLPDGDGNNVLRQIHVGFGQDLTDAASNRTFPLWGSNILLFDPRGMIGCNVYAPPEEVKTPYSIRYELSMELNTSNVTPEDPYFAVCISHIDNLVPFSFFGTSIMLIPSYSLANKTLIREIRINLGFEEHLYLPQADRPCLSDEEVGALEGGKVDLHLCTLKYLLRVAPTCFRTREETCKKEDFYFMADVVHELTGGGETEFARKIDCLPPCRRPIYKVSLQPTLEIERNAGEAADSSVHLVLQTLEPQMTYRSEYYVYDAGDLAGDMGGMVGMLLGMSILAVYDSFVAWAHRFKNVLF